jgi:hypothetical protein
MQVLPTADVSALEQLCECHALVLDLREQLKKMKGTVLEFSPAVRPEK